MDTPNGVVVKRVHLWQEVNPIDEDWARRGAYRKWVVKSDNRVVDAEALIGPVKIIGEIKWLEYSP